MGHRAIEGTADNFWCFPSFIHSNSGLRAIKSFIYQQTAFFVNENLVPQLKCCGIDGFQDWQGQKLPPSCCHADDNYEEVQAQQQSDSYCIDNGFGKYYYRTGCYDRLKMKVNGNTKVLIGVGIGIAFVEASFLSIFL